MSFLAIIAASPITDRSRRGPRVIRSANIHRSENWGDGKSYLLILSQAQQHLPEPRPICLGALHPLIRQIHELRNPLPGSPASNRVLAGVEELLRLATVIPSASIPPLARRRNIPSLLHKLVALRIVVLVEVVDRLARLFDRLLPSASRRPRRGAGSRAAGARAIAYHSGQFRSWSDRAR